jgi:hypothetical protein
VEGEGVGEAVVRRREARKGMADRWGVEVK